MDKVPILLGFLITNATEKLGKEEVAGYIVLGALGEVERGRRGQCTCVYFLWLIDRCVRS